VAPPAATPANSTQKPSSDALAADQTIPAHATSSLRPLILTPWFIVVNASVLVALAIGAVISTVRTRRTRDPLRLQRAAAEQTLNESLAVMDGALHDQDAPRFFDAARHVLRERLAAQWQVPASQVTIHEIRTRLNSHGEEVCAIFQTADEIAYSGRRYTVPDLLQWRVLVKNQLHQLARAS
jgi:hypothetical protein